MEKLAEGPTADLPSPSSRVRRRLIQSTLFPPAASGENCDKDEDEDRSGSSQTKTKKKAQRKPKATTPNFQALKKVVVINVETPSNGMEREDSTSLENDVKIPQQHKHCSSATPEKRTSATPKKRSASSTPKRQQKNNTPKKKVVDNGGCYGKMNSIQSEHASQLIPDLRLEAKLKAEENARLYGGRQIHPFFSSWKMIKKNQDKSGEESNLSSVDRKGEIINLGPIHVFERVKDDDIFLDWGKWSFIPERSGGTNLNLRSEPSAIYGRTVKSLKFDNFLSLSGQQNYRSSDHLNQVDKEFLLHSPIQQDYIYTTSSILFTDEHVAHHERSRQREENHIASKVDTYTMDAFVGQNLDIRRMAYCHDSFNQPENSLWTNKYQPKKANEICGNGDCVKFLNDWLRLWHEYGSGTNKIIGNIYSGQDADNGYTSNSDSEIIDERKRLKNVLLITGPVGSGKSAAIYACAKEQGFQVIEVNASDWRNGALVKQRFGEAVESHWLQSATADQGISNEVIVHVPLSDEISDDIRIKPAKLKSNKSETVSEQSDIKSLILFEDVDATLDEDRGLIGTIQRLAETAKRPIILTSNRIDPVLPNNLDRLELCFRKPSLMELLCLASMVCTAEKVSIPPCMVKRFIEFCREDIRKTILHLQFWCQGQTYSRDGKILGAYGLMVFDPDVGHNILPKLICCDYPSQLSEIVDKEITKSIVEVEETSHFNVVDVEEPNIDVSKGLKLQANSTDARMESMLTRHCSDQHGNELPFQLHTACENSDYSGSPIAFGRQSVQRRTDTVLSSQSGEECLTDSFPIVPSKLSQEEDLKAQFDVTSKVLSHSVSPAMSFNSMTNQLFQVTEGFSPLNSTCRSAVVSCVPDSSLAPKTELFSDAASSGLVDNMAESALITKDYPYNSFDLNISLPEIHEIPNLTRNDCDIFTHSVRQIEEITDSHIGGADTALTNYNFPVNSIDLNASPSESYDIPMLLKSSRDTMSESIQVEDSQVDCVEVVTGEYQGIDECNVNFSLRSKYKKCRGSTAASGTVQETWRKLRHCHMDLQQYAILEHKDASKVLKLAHGLSNLISEADILLNDCQILTCDYLEPSMVPCETSHSIGWYDDQSKMVSTISEHGMCLYAKDLDAASTNMFAAGRVDLAWEILASSTNTMALGKLVNQHNRRLQIQNAEMDMPQSGISSQRESVSGLCSIVQSIIPTRSYLSVKGNALHEYVSSLSQMSRSEANRISKSHDKSTKRRVRVAKNYLSTAAPSLTAKDITLLSHCNCYKKV